MAQDDTALSAVLATSDESLVAAAAARLDPQRLREIAIGSLQPGFEGCLFRLLAVCDMERIGTWIDGEVKVHGTPIVTVMDCISGLIASAALQMAGRTGRTQIKPAAAAVMSKAAQMLHRDIEKVLEAKRADSILRNKLRIIPGGSK